jgi:biotin carboxyl carrier protein
MTGSNPHVTRVGAGVYRVEQDGRGEVVYVAVSATRRWAFWNGRVFTLDAGTNAPAARPRGQAGEARQLIAAPMPATVVKVLVEPGSRVKQGDTVVVLEAMKMELPLRAAGDAVVKAVHCREGDLVQAEVVLVEME